MNSSKQTSDALNADELHLANVIDEHGQEVAITRDMIEQSLEELVINTADSKTDSSKR